MRGGETFSNMNTSTSIGLLLFVSLILGLIKYGSLADQFNDKSWQFKFVELWNDFINFLIPGLIGYYFVAIRLESLAINNSLNTTDIVLVFIFIMGLFGHLCVMSKNITDGVKAILERVLGKNY